MAMPAGSPWWWTNTTVTSTTHTSGDSNRRCCRRRRRGYQTAIVLFLVIPTYLYVFVWVLEPTEGLSYAALRDWERQRQEEREFADAHPAIFTHEGMDENSNNNAVGTTTPTHLLWRIMVVAVLVRLWFVMNAAVLTRAVMGDGSATASVLPTTTTTGTGTTSARTVLP
jgi:hypothetical protein